jgi:hypothetical protein
VIVVDSNIIGYLYLTGTRSVQCERLMRRDAEWAAPVLWRSELRNVLALYIRKKILCSAYDCEFVALARDLDVPLITIDKQVIDRFPQVAVSLDAYLETPGK